MKATDVQIGEAKVGAFPVIYDGNAETDKDAVVHKTDGTYPVMNDFTFLRPGREI